MTKKLKFVSRFMAFGLLSILLTWVLFVLTSLCVAVSVAQNSSAEWHKWQDTHIEELRANYANGSAPKIDESRFCDFNLADAMADGTKINDLRYLATHNSYKMGTTRATNFFYNYAVPLFCGKLFDYQFDTITEQFNQGIRSMEIDLNKVKTDNGFDINCLHNTLLEQNSSMIDVKKGLQEMKMWSDYNPDHMPIVILIEPKGGSFIKKYQDFDNEAFDMFEGMLTEVFGDKLITPDGVLGELGSMKEVRENNAYPTIESSKGKFIFLLHETKVLDTYIERDTTMRSQKMFVALTKDKTISSSDYTDKALYLIYNNKGDKDIISAAIKNENFVVRTRLDKYALIDDVQKSEAVASGAQIMSTDYPYSTTNRYDYVCKLTADNRTMKLLSR